jgi:phage-related protein (TIGR01555 family)
MMGDEQTRLDRATEALKRMDGWANVLVGLGGKLDKRNKTFYATHAILTDEELHDIYMGDGLGTRIIDVVADDMTREWIDLAPEEKEHDDAAEEQAEEIEKALNDLNAEQAYNLALKWKRLYGGALIIIGALDGGKLDTPLTPKRISGIENLKVIDRTDVDIASSEFQKDPNKPDFGKPIRFKVWFSVGDSRIDQMVHVSRCIVLKGKPIPPNAAKLMSIDHRFWGMSELQPIYEALRDFGGMMDSISNIMYEFIIGKLSIQGLSDLIGTKDGEAIVMNRLHIISAMKSIIHAVMLDSTENYTRDSASIAGLADIIDRYIMRLAGVAGIPVTRLFGRQASGLNNKGEAEEGIYYDSVRSKQKTELKPALIPLIELIKVIKKRDLPVVINFEPLFQQTDKEKADTEKLKAEAEAAKAGMYKSYIDGGVLDPADVYEAEWKETFGPRDFEEEIPLPEELEQVLMEEQGVQAQGQPQGGQKQPQNMPPANQPKPKKNGPGGGR